ncbi:cytochrome P450 [Punctularia strigosozonata HHB-11173 SS5]|uniref:cytochrome P450 n=1 Tax=Punctularia strigosozonata (strain HHB-11173) TaxID=741275 RepID=UPI0004417717|nr:cytochrome P450 [Punctularia strigosozonata HHB-11173 SS5]EIN08462.1 cytochrome P450 [Punctularia strigosozonata HHB-11173 SS5]
MALNTYAVVGLSLSLLWTLQKFIEFRRAVNSIGGLPGYRTLLSGASFLGNFLPKIDGVTPGRGRNWIAKHDDAEVFGWDVYSNVSVWPKTKAMLLLADPAVIKEVTSARSRFPKPVQQYRVLTFFGKNIVASEFDDWKRYRKVAAPSFSERNNKLVWDETVRIMLDMFDNVWKDKPEIVVDHAVDITLPIALFVIGVAGFGRRISWNDDLVVPPGHEMTFKDALHVVSTDVFVRLIVPERAMGLTKRLRNVRLAFKELEQYMSEMISARRTAEKKEERYDLFSSLLDASDDVAADSANTLSDSELRGNIFIFMLAGHETTAHTLCFAFGLLALYPEWQEKLYQHIKSVIPDDRLPTYEEMNLLTHSMAVFYETLRMYPPVNGVPKYSAEDTTLTTTNEAGEKRTIPVPAGTGLLINVPGLHYNPRYWKDPHTFNPSRFLDADWPRDAFLPFSAGARACIGRRFFETEGIAILSMMISRYRIEIKEEPQFAHETFEERKARVLASKPGLTMTPIRMPLVFKRR